MAEKVTAPNWTLSWTKTDFKQSKIQSTKKQVNIEAIQINFFLDLARNFFIFLAL